MNITTTTTRAGIFCLLFSTVATATVTPPDEQAMRAKVKQLGQQQQLTLQQAMQQGGAVAGITACQHAAQPIAQNLSQEGWIVGRTALRVRNPDNQADIWETQQLQFFAEQLAQGIPAESLEVIQHSADGQHIRYMRPIITAPGCLQCHGSELKEDVRNAIATAYPADQATGFAAGELRGAFSLRWTAQP